ncbi:diacylglycerol kinase [Photorhabdus heterorhabditis]|uniref:Diacylglycerol kinase n=1 Tax=Photorhabdus heterorhabditis TaxID=880156 RepID=A0A5B0WQK1_9GAMM|nr:diacylglycerol kinase [Photorhabdus heterorhabditis]KAA1188279.1 diacylglycerol kinase [Photorhabdus heterorhabditis]KOY62392.1 diacylglycerol kinase [Photorhabdus heterorhabditis]MBS9444136.1 diacylglycerol kinase [Photorhabdus heterorhabditis]NRN28176.1 diacylglycerol kinase [Photorhabdus heterorhabditis subsp. aluminescens]
MKNQSVGLTRIIKATRYSVKGIKAAWQNEAAFREEIIVAILALIVAFYLDVSVIERILLIGSIMLVLIMEILNSAIEAIVDRIGSEFHELSGRAKDMGSAAVFLTIILALIIWSTVLWQFFMG